jgi:hypothetical protein
MGGGGQPPPQLPNLPTPVPQYGARALSCILTTILSQTDNKVPLPQGYPGGDAAFFRGELGLTSLSLEGVEQQIPVWFGGLELVYWFCVERPFPLPHTQGDVDRRGSPAATRAWGPGTRGLGMFPRTLILSWKNKGVRPSPNQHPVQHHLQPLMDASDARQNRGLGTEHGTCGRTGAASWGSESQCERPLPTDMKQGLLSVGIGGRESRSGCLDVEKGESPHLHPLVEVGEQLDTTASHGPSYLQTVPSPSS